MHVPPRQRADGTRRRPIMVSGGVPSTVRRTALRLGAFTLCTLVFLGLVTYMLTPHAPSQDPPDPRDSEPRVANDGSLGEVLDSYDPLEDPPTAAPTDLSPPSDHHPGATAHSDITPLPNAGTLTNLPTPVTTPRSNTAAPTSAAIIIALRSATGVPSDLLDQLLLLQTPLNPRDTSLPSAALKEVVVVLTEHHLASDVAYMQRRYGDAASKNRVRFTLHRYVPRHQNKAVCLASMINDAERVLDSTISVLISVAPWMSIQGRVEDFVASLVAAMDAPPAWRPDGDNTELLESGAPIGPTALAGCAVLRPTETGRPEVFHHGYSLVTLIPDEASARARAGQQSPQREPFDASHLLGLSVDRLVMTRRLIGFPPQDLRVMQGMHLVDAVSLDCAALSRPTLQKMKGLPSVGVTVTDLAFAQDTSLRFETNILEYESRTEQMGYFLSKINLLHAGAAPKELKLALAKLIDAVMGARTVVNGLLVGAGDRKSLGKIDPAVERADKMAVELFVAEYEAAGLNMHTITKASEWLQDSWRRVIKSVDVGADDERSFEYSVMCLAKKYRIVATNATAVSGPPEPFLPPKIKDFGITRYYGYNSYMLTSHVTKKWGRFAAYQRSRLGMPLAHRKDRALANASLRVLWDFYCCHCCGFSTEVQDLVVALQPYVDVSVVNKRECFCGGAPTAVSEALDLAFLNPERTAHYPPSDHLVFIVHRQPSLYNEALHLQFNDQDAATRQPQFVVGRSMYEFDRIGQRWVNFTRTQVDEVWVPAAWVKDQFVRSGVNASKVYVVPETIDVNFWDPALHKTLTWPPHFVPESSMVCNRPSLNANRGTSNRPFTFFSDFKFEPRKGWDVLLDSYRMAFDESDDVVLYVNTNLFLVGVSPALVSPYNTSLIIGILNQAVFNENNTAHLSKKFATSDWPRFCLSLHKVTEDQLASMYKSADAFVLPTRGEGWGLPLIQAMAMEKPVIAPMFGGQSEFMNSENSFPIEFELVPVPSTAPYGADADPNQRWADPSRNHTAALMRLVKAHRHQAQQVGRRAREYVVRNLNYDAVARVVLKQLQRIRTLINGNVQLRESPLPPPPASPSPPTNKHVDDGATTKVFAVPDPFREALDAVVAAHGGPGGVHFG